MTREANHFPVLECRNLRVNLAGAFVVENCNFTTSAGELLALVGPNGAGKSSLLRALAQIIDYTGEVRIAGRLATDIPRRNRAQTISYLPQDRTIHWPVPVRNLVALGRLPFGHGLAMLDEEGEQAIDTAIDLCDLRALADRPVTSLSGGERARALLARAIATQADVLLADEPLAALDPAFQIAAMEILRSYAAGGRAVVAVTHDIGLAMSFASRFLVMKSGRLIGDGKGEAMFERRVFDDAFGVRFEALRNEQQQLSGIAARQGSQSNGHP